MEEALCSTSSDATPSHHTIPSSQAHQQNKNRAVFWTRHRKQRMQPSNAIAVWNTAEATPASRYRARCVRCDTAEAIPSLTQVCGLDPSHSMQLACSVTSQSNVLHGGTSCWIIALEPCPSPRSMQPSLTLGGQLQLLYREVIATAAGMALASSNAITTYECEHV